MANPFYNSFSSEPDDISLFLQQFLLRSSSSSSLPSRNVFSEKDQEPTMASFPGRIHVPDSSSGLNPFSDGWFSSSSVGTLENDLDEYDCDSEEAFEGFGEELVQKTVQGRSSAKRSRAAEVHNLSEKRRRSRINERMKALQNLIPNSNKTDKASMLDEAIEYLKQLQLQVQMLTMKNGLSLYPFPPSGVPQPDQVPDISIERSIVKAITIDPDSSADNLLNLQANCPIQGHFGDFPSIIGSKDSFQLESSMQNQYELFQLSRSSNSNCRKEVFPHQHNLEYSPTTLSGFNADSKLKDGTLEAILRDVDYLGDARIVPNLANNLNFSAHMNLNNGWKATNDCVKTERRDF